MELGGAPNTYQLRRLRPGCLVAGQSSSGKEATIHALAGTTSLRSLAVDFGVSYETIRAMVRQHHSASG